MMSKHLFLCFILFLLGVLLGVAVSHRPVSEEFTILIPPAERQALAQALFDAAEQLESGTDVQIVHEHIRTAIARQPSSSRWAEEFSALLQGADAGKLKEIAKKLADGRVETADGRQQTAAGRKRSAKRLLQPNR